MKPENIDEARQLCSKLSDYTKQREHLDKELRHISISITSMNHGTIQAQSCISHATVCAIVALLKVDLDNKIKGIETRIAEL